MYARKAIAGAVLASAGLLGGMWVSTPEAWSVPCEHRSAAHIAEHGGLAADSRWHVARGQLPTCGAEEQKDSEQAKPAQSEKKKDDGKSRFCRKRIWC